MLIKVIDIKKNNIWINPLYVKSVASKKGTTYLRGSFGGYMNADFIKTHEDPQELADRISAAMPDSPAWGAATSALLSEQQQQQTTTAAAAAGG